MKLRVVARNPRHVHVDVFVGKARNGELVFTHEEWKIFQNFFDRVYDVIEIVKLNQPECVVCGRRKKPVGRDMSPHDHLCSHECDGYNREPLPGTDWDA